MIPFCISWFAWISMHQLALYQMGLTWVEALTDSIVSNSLLIYVSMLMFTILRFYLPRKNQVINLFTWIILLTTGWFFASDKLMGLILIIHGPYVLPLVF
jgi:hypothetical protein